MESKEKVLKLLIGCIYAALLSIAFTIIYSLKVSAGAWLSLGNASGSFAEKTRFIMLFQLFKILIGRVLYIIVLFHVLRICRSILERGLFLDDQMLHIRKISFYLIGFGMFMILVNLLIASASFSVGNRAIFDAALAGMTSLFESYILTGLMVWGIAQIFMSGVELKQENDLTI